MSTSFRLLVPRSLYEEMLSQARAELPNECCGLLAGTIVEAAGRRLGRVQRRFPLTNKLKSPKEYYGDDKDQLQAQRDMRALNIDELAVYHSHPTTHAVPSPTDRERWIYEDNAICLIISLRTAEPEVRAWWLTADAALEAEWEVIEDEASLPPAGP